MLFLQIGMCKTFLALLMQITFWPSSLIHIALFFGYGSTQISFMNYEFDFFPVNPCKIAYTNFWSKSAQHLLTYFELIKILLASKNAHTLSSFNLLFWYFVGNSFRRSSLSRFTKQPFHQCVHLPIRHENRSEGGSW